MIRAILRAEQCNQIDNCRKTVSIKKESSSSCSIFISKNGNR